MGGFGTEDSAEPLVGCHITLKLDGLSTFVAHSWLYPQKHKAIYTRISILRPQESVGGPGGRLMAFPM
jgi:hypothetical protein